VPKLALGGMSGTRSGGRKVAADASIRVAMRLPPDAVRCLEMLMSEGYGTSTAEVAAYLVKREIDDLKRTGVLPRRQPS
jgi:hypothetical protein